MRSGERKGRKKGGGVGRKKKKEGTKEQKEQEEEEEEVEEEEKKSDEGRENRSGLSGRKSLPLCVKEKRTLTCRTQKT